MGMINEAAKNYLTSLGLDVGDVTDIQSEIESSGYCETCYYEEVVVVIYYIKSNGHIDTYTYYGSFGDFISTLDSFTDEPVQD